MTDHDKDWLERHYLRAVEQAVALRDQLDLAHEFRIPCTNQRGGYGEVVVSRGELSRRDMWAVTDGAYSGLRTWTDDGWRYVSDVGRAVAYRYSRDEAISVARQVAEIEGACIEAEVEAASDGGTQ